MIKFSTDFMFIFRRINVNDANVKFNTGNNAFDEKCRDGTLNAYINDDLISGGNSAPIYL